MRSIVLERARTLRHYELGVAAPTAGLVRVALALAPITEGDLDAYYDGTGKLPRVFGRTMIGSVVDAVTVDADAEDTRIITFVPTGHGRLQPGTPVAVTFDNDEDGALRELADVPAERCVPLDPEIPQRVLVFLPEIAAAAAQLTAMDLPRGAVCVIFGAELPGIFLALLAQRNGIRALLTDTAQSRLTVAQDLGVEITINPISGGVPEELEWYNGGVADAVVDTTGNSEILPSTEAILAPGSTLGLTVPIDGTLPLREVVESGITVRSLYRLQPDYPSAMEVAHLLPVQQISLLPLPMEEIPASLPALARRDMTTTRIIAYTGNDAPHL